MKLFFSFHKFSNKVTFLFIILQILAILNEYNLYSIKNINIENFYIFNQFKNISHILSVIVFLIQKKNSKRYSVVHEKNKNYIININKIEKIQFINKKFDYIILVSLSIIIVVDFIDGNFYLFQNKNSGQISQIISFYFFLKLFNHNIYRHHYLGIFLSLISYFNETLTFIFLSYKNKIDLYIYLDSILIQFMIGLKYTLEKYLIEIKYFNRYLLLFYEGFYSLIINIIYYLFLYFFYKDFIINFSFIKENILFLLLYMIELFFIENIRVLLASLTKNIIFFFAIIFTSYVGRLIFFNNNHIIKLFVNGPDSLIFKIDPALNILGCLIFSEIIIFNFCKLNENIESEIIKRAEKEKELS